MKIESVDANKIIEKAQALVEHDQNLSPSIKDIIESLISLTKTLIDKLKLNSSNSSKPPSSDPNRKKKKTKKSNKSRGGQIGHQGTSLVPVSDPDEIETLTIDRRRLPRDKEYQQGDYISRQVVDIQVSKIVTEYRAQVLIDNEGNQYVAEFPEGVDRPIQYGASVKAKSICLSTYQLIPYKRVQEQFQNEYDIPISPGSIYNFNAQGAKLLLELGFDLVAKQELLKSECDHADETSININGKKAWLHTLSNENWTWIVPHAKRGSDAMNDIGLIPLFNGVLCHDHWKPYYKYDCQHSLCNAHHLRELTRAYKNDGQQWAEDMRILLLEINEEVNATKKGRLSKKKAKKRTEQYREILDRGNKECPELQPPPNQKRRPKQTKSRNLLERLRDFEGDVLRFMRESIVPFTNNLGERDIRMFKVQQKISGCFRAMEAAVNFAILRSYLSTCKKNGLSATQALEILFSRKLPDFIQEKLESG